MGRVLLGRQRSLDRDVAIKTVKPELSGTTHADALIREGVITGTLEHPNITPVHQLGVDHEGGRPVLVMKRIVGTSWSDLVENPDAPFWEKLDALPHDRLHAHLEILGSVANALAYAHSRGVIHRDVKPDNVMIGEFGEVYLVDFGIATKLSGDERPKGLVGTPAFMAPEMIDERMPLGPHTDVYLLGATLHFLLTGGPRHAGSTLPEVLSAAFISSPHPYDASVPSELAALANHATERDPELRPMSASAFQKALRRYFTHRSARALSDAAETRLDALERVDAASIDAAALARLVSECRFGFLMALRDWPECPSAKLGLVRCLERIGGDRGRAG
jgi:serine/threonine protein kinase